MSDSCLKSELDLFSSYPVNYSIESSRYVSISSNEQFHFNDKSFTINVPCGSDYIDLNDIYLSIDIDFGTLVNDNGFVNFKKWVDTDKFGPINNFGHSLFKSIQVVVKTPDGLETIVEKGDNDYHYKAYLMNLLNFGDESKKGWLNNCLYCQDTPKQFDNVELPANDVIKTRDSFVLSENQSLVQSIFNFGFLERRKIISSGKGNVKLIMPLYIDMLQTNKLLPSQYGLKFTFQYNEKPLCLMGSIENCSFKVNSAKLLVRQCKVNNEIVSAHLKAMELGPIRYPLKSHRIFTRIIDTNVRELQHTISLVVPNKIIFGIIKETAYEGQLKENPFNFDHNDLKTAELTVNGNCHYKIDINNFDNDFVEGYHSLLESMNVYCSNNKSLTPEEYQNGCYLFGVNFNPDKGCAGQFNPHVLNPCCINLKFNKVIKSKLRLIILAEYDNQLSIYRQNNQYKIKYDYDDFSLNR